MSDYSKTTNFTAKDALADSDPLKIIKGSYFDTEFDAIAVASATKYDSGDLASQAEAEALSSGTKLITPERLNDVLADNASMLQDIQALTDPGADQLLGWDESANAVIGFTLGAGLAFSTTTLNLADAVAGAGLAISSSVLSVNADQGVKIEADTVRLVDVATAAGQPVAVTNGTFSFTGASIAELTVSNMNQANDGFLVFDANVVKRMQYDECGVKVLTVSGATDTIGQSDMNTFIEYTDAAGGVVVTLNTSTGDVGNFIIIKQTGGSQVSIAGTATLESAGSLVATRTTNSVICLVQIAAGVWALYGDLA